MASESEILMLETDLMVLDLEIEDLQRKRADKFMELKLKRAESEI